MTFNFEFYNASSNFFFFSLLVDDFRPNMLAFHIAHGFVLDNFYSETLDF